MCAGFLAKELALDLLDTPVCRAWNASKGFLADKESPLAICRFFHGQATDKPLASQ